MSLFILLSKTLNMMTYHKWRITIVTYDSKAYTMYLFLHFLSCCNCVFFYTCKNDELHMCIVRRPGYIMSEKEIDSCCFQSKFLRNKTFYSLFMVLSKFELDNFKYFYNSKISLNLFFKFLQSLFIIFEIENINFYLQL